MEMFSAFNELMQRGGPIMWVIFMTASVAAIMLVERAIQIRRWLKAALNDQQFMHEEDIATIVSLQNEPSFRHESPVRTILRQVRWQEAANRGDMTRQINTLLSELMPRIDGLLPTIAVIGTLLPMLGLLGTVTGMINVFEVIALHGTGNPQEMAHGISQALLTTASGLVIAIPVIFFHHLLVQRLQIVLAATEQSLLVAVNRVVCERG
ncbi:MAG: MotA/TolQ/ExbB proton channel family protein [Mariprofundaceae bacterium]